MIASLYSAAPLLLIVAIVFAVLAIRYSAAGTAVLVAFIFLNLSDALVRYQFPSLLQLLVVALAFAAWLKRDTASAREVLLHPITIAIAVWLLLAFVSTAWADNRRVADDALIDLVKAFALYLLATALMRNRKRITQGLAALLMSAAFLGLLATYQFATNQRSREFGGFARHELAQIYGDVFEPRLAGPVGDPNFYAQALLVAVPFAIILAFATRRTWMRLALLATGVVVLFTVALTYSRGAMVAAAAMAILMIRPLHVNRAAIAIAIPLALVTVLMLPAGVTRRFATVSELLPVADDSLRGDSSIAERRVYMAVAVAMFSRFPMHGVGIGNYTEHYEEYLGEVASAARLYSRSNPSRYPHNLYLQIAAETGMIGLALFGAVLVTVFAAVRRAGRSDDRQLAQVATATGISIAGFLVSSLFLHLSLPRYLFLLFAFAASTDRAARAEVEA